MTAESDYGTLELSGSGDSYSIDLFTSVYDDRSEDVRGSIYDFRMSDFDLGVTVTSVSADAFSGCDGMRSVVLDPSVKTLGDRAFADCCYIKKLEMPGVETIGEDAFRNSDRIRDLAMPALRQAGPGAFSTEHPDDAMLSVSVPNLEYASDDMFRGRTNMKTLEAPLISSAGDRAFMDCNYLTNVNGEVNQTMIVNLPKITHVGKDAFARCFFFLHANMPLLETVDDRGFANAGITYLNAPMLKSVGDRAFQYNTIEELDLPNLEYVGDLAFLGNKLGYVSTPEIRHVGAAAFVGNWGLYHVSLHSTESIGAFAFYHTSINRPLSLGPLQELGLAAFAGCGITSFSVKEGSAYTEIDGALYSDDELALCPGDYDGELVVPEFVTSIAPYACAWAHIDRVIMNDGVVSIGYKAFADCETGYISVPESVKHIGDGAFAGMTFMDGQSEITQKKDLPGYAYAGVNNVLHRLYTPDPVTVTFVDTGGDRLFDLQGVPEEPIGDLLESAVPDGKRIVSLNDLEGRPVTLDKVPFADTRLVATLGDAPDDGSHGLALAGIAAAVVVILVASALVYRGKH